MDLLSGHHRRLTLRSEVLRTLLPGTPEPLAPGDTLTIPKGQMVLLHSETTNPGEEASLIEALGPLSVHGPALVGQPRKSSFGAVQAAVRAQVRGPLLAAGVIAVLLVVALGLLMISPMAVVGSPDGRLGWLGTALFMGGFVAMATFIVAFALYAIGRATQGHSIARSRPTAVVATTDGRHVRIYTDTLPATNPSARS